MRYQHMLTAIGALGGTGFDLPPGNLGHEDLSALFRVDSVVTNSEGLYTDTYSYFLDPDHTQSAGVIILTQHRGNIVDGKVRLTAGDLAGTASTYELRVSTDPDRLGHTFHSESTLPDGAAVTADLKVSVVGTTFIGPVGTELIKAPGGLQTRWEIDCEETGKDFRATSSDHTICTLHCDPLDSFGYGALATAGGRALAACYWNSAGDGQVIYSDGSSEPFSLSAAGFF